MLKYVKSDIDLDLNDGDTVSNHNLYCTHGIFFFILAISEGIV